MRPQKKLISINIIVKVLATLAEVVLPVILAYIVDDLAPSKNIKAVYYWGGLMIVLSLLAWVLNITANRMASKASSVAIQNIRQDLFERSMHLSAKQIDKIGISSLESRLTSDTYVIHRFLGATLRMGLRSLMLFFGGVVFSVYLSPRLSLVLIFLIVPLVFVIRYIFSKAMPLFRKVQRSVDNMVQIIRESIRGIKVAKALDKVDYEKERYFDASKTVSQSEIKAVDQMAMMGPIVNTILYGGLTIVMIWGSRLINNGVLQVGVIIAFTSYFIQITNSLMMMNRMVNMYNRSLASTQRISEVIDMPIDENQIIEEEIDLPASNPLVPEIEFKEVSFSYLGVTNDIDKVSFKLYPGDTLGIMGATGSGKSTIVRLLLRQYDVDQGEILVRGVNIKKLSHKQLNRLFGSVFQNDFLYRGSIRENVDFGRDIEDQELLTAASHAQALEFLKSKEGGLDFELASKGVNLSGGQKQRLLLTRAFASDPDILILDDSSSALDFRTDSKLRKALQDYYKDTTSIIVAQRVSSVLHAKQIMFLDEGKIQAIGSHEELLEQSDAYREIASMQMGNLDEYEGEEDLAWN